MQLTRAMVPSDCRAILWVFVVLGGFVSAEKTLLSRSASRRAANAVLVGSSPHILAATHLLRDQGQLNRSAAGDSTAAFKAEALNVACPIEDHLLGMAPEMKEAMRQEMYTGPVGTAITFVRSHKNEGWTYCASKDQMCQCAGRVRFGSYNGGWPQFTQPIPVQGQVACAQTSFAQQLTVLEGLRCECSQDAEANWQNVALRYNSVSYLQETWIALTRVLAQSGMLPFNGDRQWQGENHFSMRGGTSLDRYWVNLFLEDTKLQHIGTTGPNVCLEWAPVVYMPGYPGCVAGRQLSLEYTGDPNAMRVDGNTVYADNVNLPRILGGVQPDFVLSTNVWEHEAEPFAAIQALHTVMKPGGIMVFTVPFVAPFHGVPHDYYRYTKSGVLHVLEGAGFCVPRASMASGGDYIFNMALMAGVAPGDFSDAELRGAYHRGYDNVGDGAMVIMALAVKKTDANAPCPP